MTRRTQLFLGLIRPPRYLGLPLFYSAVWIIGSVILLIWTGSLWFISVPIVVYPMLWIAAEWDPFFIDVAATVSKKTRRTKNRDHWGADSYEP